MALVASEKEGGRESLRSPAPRVASGDEPEASQALAEPRRRGGVVVRVTVPVWAWCPVPSSPVEGVRSSRLPSEPDLGLELLSKRQSYARSPSVARWLTRDGPCRGGPRPRV